MEKIQSENGKERYYRQTELNTGRKRLKRNTTGEREKERERQIKIESKTDGDVEKKRLKQREE